MAKCNSLLENTTLNKKDETTLKFFQVDIWTVSLCHEEKKRGKQKANNLILPLITEKTIFLCYQSGGGVDLISSKPTSKSVC